MRWKNPATHQPKLAAPVLCALSDGSLAMGKLVSLPPPQDGRPDATFLGSIGLFWTACKPGPSGVERLAVVAWAKVEHPAEVASKAAAEAQAGSAAQP